MSVHVFGYGSLVAPEGLARTLERPVDAVSAELHAWRRRWSLLRDNHTAEKTFALPDGSLPDYILGLNVEGEAEDKAGPVNGALIEVADGDLERLDRRELRYDRVDVSDQITLRNTDAQAPRVVFTYTAKRPQHFAPAPPPNSVIVAAYLAIVERGFKALGPGELERYRATTGPNPVEVVEATLVKDQIRPGNPRDW
jgi:cation transport regulator ChaC